MDDLIKKNLVILKEMNHKESAAFRKWFRGGLKLVRKRNDRDGVTFGKAECEMVDFEEFWLGKMPKLGWMKVELIKENDRVKEYRITPTVLGFDVYRAYMGLTA